MQCDDKSGDADSFCEQVEQMSDQMGKHYLKY